MASRASAAIGTAIVAALWLVAAATPAGAQAVPGRESPNREKPATARLSGRVVAVDTGRPLRGAIVHIVSTGARNPNERQGLWVTTDAEGRWALADLQPGGFTVSVEKGGYLTLHYGQKRPFEPGKTIALTAGQSFENADVMLPRPGVISGKLVDEFGDPVAGALVRALRYKYLDGQRQLTPIVDGMEAVMQGGLTDDLGNYRLYGLTPGDYYICAVFVPRGESANHFGHPPTYFPGTPIAAESRRISLGMGQEAANTNFNLSTARYASMSGTVVGSSGAPIAATVTLKSADAADLVALPSVSASGGTFAIPNVAPGDYRIQVHTAAGGIQNVAGVMEFATLPISIDGQDVTGLVIATAPGANASGRVRFDGASDPPGRLYVRTLPMTPGAPGYMMASAGVNPDSTFEARGLTGRQAFDVGTLPPGWFLKSVSHQGKDITDAGYDFKPGQSVSGIQIMLSQTATALSGTAQDDQARPIADYTVVAFSSDSARWGYRTRFVRSVRPDQHGRFTLRGLPPDEYVVVALEYVETGQENDPERLANWSTTGTKVTLGEGEARTVTLKVLQ
jgi:protocatechuate 3,4-dioxygenase beta subunit